MWGKVSESCDVYSYGVLLLEIVSSKKPIEKHSNGVKRDIVRWAKPLVERGRLEQMVDPRLKGRFDRGELETAVLVGMRCVSSNPENRPTMAEIVAFLRSGAERRKKEVVAAAAVEEEEDESYERGIAQLAALQGGRRLVQNSGREVSYGSCDVVCMSNGVREQHSVKHKFDL